MKSFNNFNQSATKRVSYILATKNRAKLLDKTFKMIRQLKKSGDEFIVVDGKSTDGTKKVVQKYKNLIDFFISESDLNTNHAYNKGILLANGKYIKYICDDDIIYPEAMEEAIKVMEKNPDIELLVCGGSRYRKSTKKFQTVYLPAGTNFGKEVDDVFRYGTNGVGFIIRRSAYAKAGIAPFDWNADLTFAVNCIKNGVRTKFCRIKLYHQTIYDFSINSTRKRERRDDYLKLLRDNASRKFYLKFRVNLFIYEHRLVNMLLQPLVYTLYLARQTWNAGKKNNKEKPLYNWDGGFS